MNKSIPTESLLKYIVKDRDEYKRRLDMLVPYTKSLEAELERYRAVCPPDGMASMKDLALRAELLKEENKALRKDYKTSDWFKQLTRQSKKLQEENKRLKSTISDLINRLIKENQETI